MATFNLKNKNSIAGRFVAELRDVQIQKDRMRFRRNLERLGEIFAYEISQTLEYASRSIETPLGIAEAQLPAQQIVLATILRAGIPLHQGLLNYFDDADSAFVSAYRKHHKSGQFDIKVEYITCPPLDDKVLIICDPMLATGASMDLSIKALLENGQPAELHIVTAIASTSGLSYIKRLYPKAHIWLGDQDEELTAKSYIVPGLGDAGDLCFGSKIQE
ncbi:MAG: uracil phosphoribosyltransferase [Bacteroidota bacterium]